MTDPALHVGRCREMSSTSVCPDGKPYRVEVSDDLTRWSTVSDTIAEGGQVEFVQPDMTGFKHCFYRVRPIVIEALDDD